MINTEIKEHQVYLIDSETKQLTLMCTDDALSMADEMGEDLVQLSYKENIPICKICDFKKLQYEKQKKEKENKKKARLNAQEIKEVRLGDSIATHDMKIKAKNIDRMLLDGDKVQVVIRYKGRTARFVEQGVDKLKELAELVTVQYNIEKEPKVQGNQVMMLVAPIKK